MYGTVKFMTMFRKARKSALGSPFSGFAEIKHGITGTSTEQQQPRSLVRTVA